jgi:hypothetical protein
MAVLDHIERLPAGVARLDAQHERAWRSAHARRIARRGRGS